MRGAEKSVIEPIRVNPAELFTSSVLRSSPDKPQEPHSTVPVQAVLASQRTGSPLKAGSHLPWALPTPQCLLLSHMQLVVTKCLSKNRLSRCLRSGQWPFRALPGCPLGGGRVLSLHTLASLLPLLKIQGHSLWLKLRKLDGEERKGLLSASSAVRPQPHCPVLSSPSRTSGERSVPRQTSGDQGGPIHWLAVISWGLTLPQPRHYVHPGVTEPRC